MPADPHDAAVAPVPQGARVTVVGGGPAGLIAAEVLARSGVVVTVLERMPSVGRKLLIAGHGGLNITHSEEHLAFLGRYGAAAERLAPALEAFSPADLREWCASLGEPTFVGSSRRVFPESFRANPLHRAWRGRLADLGVITLTRRRWTGWGEVPGVVRATGPDGEVELAADAVVLALGGASWPHLGSDGSWVPLLRERGVEVTPLVAANVGLRAGWTPVFAERFAGVPVKHVELAVPDRPGARVRGDAMITGEGIEGGPVYAIGAAVRSVLEERGTCRLTLDLRPEVPLASLTERLRRRRPRDSVASWLRRSVGLDPVSTGLLREAAGGPLPSDPEAVARLVRELPVTVTGTMPIERAISTAGGVAWSEVDDDLMLRRVPGTFVAGEMLDWEAPTGGYLLQASYSTGVVAAHGVLRRLAAR